MAVNAGMAGSRKLQEGRLGVCDLPGCYANTNREMRTCSREASSR